MLLGVVALAIGTTVAIAFGPDDTLSVGPHELSTTGMAVITAPGVLPYSGPTLQVTATVSRPTSTVFVGVGHDVDVRDYLSKAAYTRIDRVSLPWRTETTQVPGTTRALTDPSELTWWLTSASGSGAAAVTFPLPDAPIDVVATDVDSAPGFTTDVTVRIVQEGVFAGAVGLLVGGVGPLVAGPLLLRSRRIGADRQPAGSARHNQVGPP